ncbi:MAG TPA: c-type cytochrome biogenesis protein CcmI [Burkholderiales bacterium]|nr:c-type cytochrome biogenesis protein CcmI [Burkholderiales bacterium]
MIVFAILALLLLVAALVVVLRPLLKARAAPSVGRSLSNLEIHRDQFAELERDLASGALNAQSYEQARSELERRVIEEAALPEEAAPVARAGKATPIVVGALIPVVAIALYLHLGNLQGIVAPPHPAADLSSVTAEQFRDMTAKLAARLKTNPGDAEGWKMLGRAYRAMENFGEASAAYGKAVALKPDDADLLADYAESLALVAGRSMAGEPTKLLDRALKLAPDNPKILALAGSAAFERKDYKNAVRYWEGILKHPDVDADLAQALQKGIAEAKARMSGKAGPSDKPVASTSAGKERISGEVSLDPGLLAATQPDDVVFVFARAAAGPRVPLAIAKIRVRDLPYRFAFDDTSAMMPDMKLSKFGEVVVGARVSKSGSAAPAPGDLEGQSATVKPGQSGIAVRIDRKAGQP